MKAWASCLQLHTEIFKVCFQNMFHFAIELLKTFCELDLNFNSRSKIISVIHVIVTVKIGNYNFHPRHSIWHSFILDDRQVWALCKTRFAQTFHATLWRTEISFKKWGSKEFPITGFYLSLSFTSKRSPVRTLFPWRSQGLASVIFASWTLLLAKSKGFSQLFYCLQYIPKRRNWDSSVEDEGPGMTTYWTRGYFFSASKVAMRYELFWSSVWVEHWNIGSNVGVISSTPIPGVFPPWFCTGSKCFNWICLLCDLRLSRFYCPMEASGTFFVIRSIRHASWSSSITTHACFT